MAKGKKTGGRKAGVPNKVGGKSAATFARLNFDPLENLIHWARGDLKALRMKPIVTVLPNGASVEINPITPQMMLQATMEACEYYAPKLKSIEHAADEKLQNTLTDLVKSLADDLGSD